MKRGQHIDRLEEFCRSNPELWIGKYEFFKDSKNVEREELELQLEQAIKDYRYVSRRKSRGELSAEDIERLKEAGVGGVFGYTKEIENIANKYNYEDIGFFKNFLACACAKYGNLDGFRNHYIQSLTDDISSRYDVGILLKKSVQKSSILDKYFITEFDLSNPNFQSECPKGYARLYGEISQSQSIVFDREAFDNAIEGNEYLNDRERDVLRLRFGLENNEPITLEEVGKKYNVNKESVRQIEGRAIRKVRAFLRGHSKIKNPENKYSQYSTLKKDIEVTFIKKYFEYHDIFADTKVVELDENVKTVLQGIINGEKISNSDVKTIETLCLSGRAYNALKRARIDDISILTELTQEKLIRINNLGPQTIDEIIEKVHSLGLKMKWEKDSKTITTDTVTSKTVSTDDKASIDIELVNSIQSLKNAYKILIKCENKYEQLCSIMQEEAKKDIGEKE